MYNKFDELAQGLAQSVTRRQALKRFGVGLAGMALACFGLPNKAEANNCQTCLENCKAGGGGVQFCHDLCFSVCKGKLP